jgi:predicted RNA-binding protein with PUA-like domain
MRYWLMKTEPGVYSIDDLRRDKKTGWEGVRNYQVRNWLRDEVKVDDRVLFYHSNVEPPGVVGLAGVVREGYPEPFAFDPKHKYFDPGSKPENPRWFTVDVGFVERWREPVSLEELKADPRLQGMEVTRRGSRLSVHPVSAEHFERVVEKGRAKGGGP